MIENSVGAGAGSVAVAVGRTAVTVAAGTASPIVQPINQNVSMTRKVSGWGGCFRCIRFYLRPF